MIGSYRIGAKTQNSSKTGAISPNRKTPTGETSEEVATKKSEQTLHNTERM